MFNPGRFSPRVACGFLLLVVCVIVSSAAGSTWTGSADANWSNPANWNWWEGVPNGADATVELNIGSTPGRIFQDISAGATVAQITAQQTGSNGTKFLIDGNTVHLADGGLVAYTGSSPISTIPLVVQAPVNLLGTATLNAAASDRASFNYVNLLYSAGGNGSLTSTGRPGWYSTNVILNPSYTGTTTVRSGTLRLGGSKTENGFSYQYYTANTSNQGDYIVMPGANLTGMGTIGLASGAKMTIAGTLACGAGDHLGFGEDGGAGRSITVLGDVVFADGGTYLANWLGNFARLTVQGTLDLRGVDDRIGPVGPTQFLPAGSYVVIEYQNRLGSFDIGPTWLPGASVSYSNGENSGPGQVLLTVPEPNAALMSLAVAMLGTRARRRSGARTRIRPASSLSSLATWR